MIRADGKAAKHDGSVARVTSRLVLCPTSQDSATVSTAVKLVRMRICTDRM